ncbi:MAG: tetratricopeptide repeat protein [Candidatus Omnitrophota bacterium]
MFKPKSPRSKSELILDYPLPGWNLRIRSLFVAGILSLVIVAQLAFGNFIFSSFADAPAREEEALFLAQKAYEDGYYDVSLGLLERFLRDYPDSSRTIEANLLIGECFFYQNKLKPALAKFDELLKSPAAKPIKDALYYWIAEINFKVNNYGAAIPYYEKVIKEFPGSSYVPIAYYSLGWCLFQEGRFEEALHYFTSLSREYPENPQSKDAAFKIIECLYNLKDYHGLKDKTDLAIREFSQDPLKAPYLYFYLGEANYYLGNFTASVEAYSKGLDANPDNKIQALTRLDLGWAYLKLKRYKDAEDVFAGLKREDLEKRNLEVLLLGRATLLMETNRINQAKKTYEELSNLTSDPLIALQGLMGKADALYGLADYPEASKVFREALTKIDPKDKASAQIADKLRYSLGKSLLNEGRIKEAIDEFRKVVDSGSDDMFKINALCQIGDAYQDEANYKKAQETYDFFLKRYPDSSCSDYALYQLGSVYLKDSRIEEAILSLEAFEKRFPASNFLDDAAYTLGLAYFNKRDYTSAEHELKRFQAGLSSSDTRPKALYLLGNCFYNSGDYASALQVFKEIPRSGCGTLDAGLLQKAEYGQADSLYQMGKEEEALARFKALRSKYPDSSFTPDIIWWLGIYYYRHKEPDLAGRYFLSIIQDFPKSGLLPDAYYALGLTYIDKDKNKEALDYLEKALSFNKADVNPKAAVALAELFSKSGDYDNALLYYRSSINGAPLEDLPALHFKIAEIEEAKGNLDEAEKEYFQATKLSGKADAFTVKALFRLGRAYEDKGNYQEAIKAYTIILNMNLPESKYAAERINQLK